ncbi:hypothetical protein PL75_06815 [Neisseria arctica]|uniref:Curli production assembly/transport component CsgG n=1 Tax=Neisseria arctica TaxID=1470200 RepID=A0A0J0YRM4_9NEIS|nr:hypothetical protein [Neisseria arctica]KLT72781.1 hypothetical protein PL75_06815 [Neisseria arctica]UOO87280.1 CsgG/HfaB family protein [Neisseria arctica]
MINTSLKTSIIAAAAALALSACTTTDLELSRAHYRSEKSLQKQQKVADERSKQISTDRTFYGKKLECLSNLHKDFFDAQTIAAQKSGQLKNNSRFRMSVAPIRDKTGKIFDTNSTVLSDMVMDSLVHFKHFDVLETPLSPDGLADSRNNFLDPRYGMQPGIIQNFAATMTTLQHLPIGVLFPSNYYISGAIIQYDESDVLPSKRSIAADIYQYQFRHDVSMITTTINLRLIDSWTGAIVRTQTGDLASINLTNAIYTIKTGNNFFRLIGTKDYGLDYSVEVSDPKTAAIKEMIDKGVYELLDKFLKPYQVRSQEC